MNQRKGENDGRRHFFMINVHESYVAELGLELTTPGSAARCVTEPGPQVLVMIKWVL